MGALQSRNTNYALDFVCRSKIELVKINPALTGFCLQPPVMEFLLAQNTEMGVFCFAFYRLLISV